MALTRAPFPPPTIAPSPRIPVSIKDQAAAVVVQAAKEWARLNRRAVTATEIGDAQNRLADAVRMLEQLEG